MRQGSGAKRFANTALLGLFACGFSCSGFWTASIADTTPKSEATYPITVRQMPPKGEGGWREDTLIVIANPRSTKDDLEDAIKEVKGTVKRKIQVGKQEFLVIKTERGKLEETYKEMAKDPEHFSLVQRNFTYKKEDCNIVDDPAFPTQYELPFLNVPNGWCNSTAGQGVRIAILDTGVNPVQELNGRLQGGFNATVGSGPGNVDTDPGSLGHGTACATVAAAASNNGLNSASPAYNAQIYPIIISDSEGYTDDETLITALGHCDAQGIRIASCSFNSIPPYSFSSAFWHPALQVAMTSYNDNGGILFNAAGNEHKKSKDPLRPNLIVVSAIDYTLKLAKFSNTGSSVWFAAPGVLVQCSDKNGSPVHISGTSFSAPITAGVAAMVASAHPGETGNDTVLRMASTAFRAWKKYSAKNFGYGIPDAGLACQ